MVIKHLKIVSMMKYHGHIYYNSCLLEGPAISYVGEKGWEQKMGGLESPKEGLGRGGSFLTRSKQASMSRSMQLHYISATAFS